MELCPFNIESCQLWREMPTHIASTLSPPYTDQERTGIFINLTSHPFTMSATAYFAPTDFNPDPTTEQTAVFVTGTTVLPSERLPKNFLLILYANIFDIQEGSEMEDDPEPDTLRCLFDSVLEGPAFLAPELFTENTRLMSTQSLQAHYSTFKNMVVFVNERMAQEDAMLATHWRINAVFIIQSTGVSEDDGARYDAGSVNINAVTAFAGPQSSALVQMKDKYYYYRGCANPWLLSIEDLRFGSNITKVVETVGLGSLLNPRVQRVVNLEEPKNLFLPHSGVTICPEELKGLFNALAIEDIKSLEHDMAVIAPQLQVFAPEYIESRPSSPRAAIHHHLARRSEPPHGPKPVGISAQCKHCLSNN